MTKYKEFNDEYIDYDKEALDGSEDSIWTSRITHVIVCHYSARPNYGEKGLEIGEPCESCDEPVQNKVAELLLGTQGFIDKFDHCDTPY